MRKPVSCPKHKHNWNKAGRTHRPDIAGATVEKLRCLDCGASKERVVIQK